MDSRVDREIAFRRLQELYVQRHEIDGAIVRLEQLLRW